MIKISVFVFDLKNYLLRPNPPRLRPKPDLLPKLWLLPLPKPPLRTGPELRVPNERDELPDEPNLLRLLTRDDMAGEVLGLNEV